MKTIRVAVVGVGYLGRFHAEKYAAMADVELVGVVDTDLSQARTVAQKLQTEAYTDYRELLGKVDAVSVVVPTPAHFSVARDFLLHDADLMIEKPMTSTLAEADALIDLAEERGLIIQVGHLERFNSAVVALKDIVKKPMFIESHRLSLFKGRGIDVSVVLDLMIHDIDIISNFVRADIKHLHAAGIPVVTDQVDIANARIEYETGCVANITASRISTKNQRKIRLFQRDAYISVDFASHEITVVRQNGHSNQGIIPGLDIQNLCFTHGDALDDELRAFVKSVQRKEPCEVTGQMGRDALKVALTIMDQINDTNRKFLDL